MFYSIMQAESLCDADPSLIFSLIKENDIEVVEKIISKEGFDFNTIDSDGNNVIMYLLKNKNYDLVLFATRNNLEATKWLIKNGMDRYFKDVTSVKTPAYIYLDDRAIGFSGDFQTTLKQIEDFKVYWK